MSTQLRRGRPLGSGKDDQAHLDAIADLWIANPSIKTKTAAINRYLCTTPDSTTTDDTLRRRFQDKWRSHGEAVLVAARQRAAARHERTQPVSRPAGLDTRLLFQQAQAAQQQIRDLNRSLAQMGGFQKVVREMLEAHRAFSRVPPMQLKQMVELGRTVFRP